MEQPQEILLSRRNKQVRIRTGATRHGLGLAKAIDLAYSTADVDADLTIHNGIRYGGPTQCPWPVCMEFTEGDHFLAVIRVKAGETVNLEQASPSSPPAWHQPERWQLGLDSAAAPLFF